MQCLDLKELFSVSFAANLENFAQRLESVITYKFMTQRKLKNLIFCVFYSFYFKLEISHTQDIDEYK